MPEAIVVIVKLVVAVVFGGAVGWQREAKDRPAGLRTHVLVCVGSAVYALASMSFGTGSDPARVAAQVATGMGFLGAGTIIRHGSVVRGLTTAASLWAVAAIGICIALGESGFWIAGVATAVVLLTLTAMRSVEVRLLPRERPARLTLRLTGGPDTAAAVREALGAKGVTVESVEMAAAGPGDLREMRLLVELPGGCALTDLVETLSSIERVESVRGE